MLNTSTQTSHKEPRTFDLNSEEDDRELKNWCRLHWKDTLSKPIQSKNASIYHDCCVSFSKKGCVKRHSHPPLQSASVLKIPTLRNTTTPEALHQWIRERLKVHSRLGKILYFPSINVAHFHSEEDSAPEDLYDTVEMLSKRNEILIEENEKISTEIKALREENKKLLASSKCWYAMYQELQFKLQEETPSYAEATPRKLLKITPIKDVFSL